MISTIRLWPWLCLAFIPVFVIAQPGPPPAPTPPLFTVIRSGDARLLEKMLDTAAGANTIANGYSALMTAALCGTAEEMKLLLKHGAEPGFRNADSVTALWIAIPDYEKTMLLLEAGADVNMPGKDGFMPVVKLALTPGSAPLMKAFVAKGADLKKSGPDNFLLFNAAGTDDTAMLALCLAAGCRPNDSTYFGSYPIVNATSYKAFNTTKMLVEHGANLNAEGYFGPIHFGCTPLMNAALAGDRATLMYLLDRGADPNYKSNVGMTALMCAMQALEDDPLITKALLDHGADPEQRMADGVSAMDFAIKTGNTESVALLKKRLK